MKRNIFTVMIVFFGVILLTTSCVTSPPGKNDTIKYVPATFADLFEKSANAVVMITNHQRLKTKYGGANESNELRKFASGSGFIMEPDGYIVTNHHVIEGGEKITVTLRNGEELTATVIGSDPAVDLALIKIAGKDLPALEFSKDETRVGDWVIAVGTPYGLKFSLTQGIISGKRKKLNIAGPYDDHLQTDAAINPGNSGGPLINMSGKVVGVNAAKFDNPFTMKEANIGFAISSPVAEAVIAMLKERGKVTRGLIGARIREEKGEVTVVDVIPRYPAEKAGLRIGDVILTINEKLTENVFEQIAACLPGLPTEIKIRRDSREMIITVIPERRIDATEYEPDIFEGGKITDWDLEKSVMNKCTVPELERIMGLPEEPLFETLDGRKIDMKSLVAAGLPSGFQHYDSQIVTAKVPVSATAKNKMEIKCRIWWRVGNTCRKNATGKEYPKRYGDFWEIYRPNGEFLGFGVWDSMINNYRPVFINPYATPQPVEAL